MHGSGLDPNRWWLRYQRYPYLLAKIVTFALVAFGLWWVLRSIESVLFPVLLSLGLAYLLDPAVDWFEERGLSRTTGILVFLALGLVLLAVFLLFLYPTIAHLLERVGAGVPALITAVQESAIPWIEANTGYTLPSTFDDLLAEYGETVQAQLPTVANTVAKTAADLWGRTGALAASVLNLVLIPVLTFYFLRDFDVMKGRAADLLPAHNRDWLVERFSRIDEVVGAWFRGQVEVAVILAVLYAVGLGLTFGVSGIGATSGIAIGLLAGFLNIIPYFGFAIGFVLAVLMALLDWAGWWPLVGALATFGVVQGLEGYVITPRIVGEKVGLNPVTVIIALLLGGEVLGLLGVLLALPIAGSIRVLLPDLLAWYHSSSLYLGEEGTDAIDEAVVPPAAEE